MGKPLLITEKMETVNDVAISRAITVNEKWE